MLNTAKTVQEDDNVLVVSGPKAREMNAEASLVEFAKPPVVGKRKAAGVLFVEQRPKTVCATSVDVDLERPSVIVRAILKVVRSFFMPLC